MKSSPNLGRIHEHMDGLRGFLVLAVILTHIFYLSVFQPGMQPWYNRMTLWFQPVMCAVGLFVLISGYCLMLPVAHSDTRSLSGGIRGYLRRRLRRILPPYYVAALLSLGHIYLMSATYARWSMVRDPWHAGTLWSHLLLFYNLNPAWRYQINAPFWSLAAEWQMYLLFPLVLVPLWRKLGLGTLLGTATLATVLLILAGDAVCQIHPWYLLLFVCGMAGAVATSSTDPQVMARRDRVPWAGISFALIALFTVEWGWLIVFHPTIFTYLPLAWQQYCFNEMTLGMALLAGLLHWNRVQRAHAIDGWPMVLRLLHHRSVTWVGSFSYSLYLVHWPILITVIGLIRARNLGEGPTLIAAYLLATPSAVGLGYAFFLAVERRFLPTYAKKLQPTVAALVPGKP